VNLKYITKVIISETSNFPDKANSLKPARIYSSAAAKVASTYPKVYPKLKDGGYCARQNTHFQRIHVKSAAGPLSSAVAEIITNSKRVRTESNKNLAKTETESFLLEERRRQWAHTDTFMKIKSLSNCRALITVSAHIQQRITTASLSPSNKVTNYSTLTFVSTHFYYVCNNSRLLLLLLQKRAVRARRREYIF